jgi:hypothetical protein
MAPDEGDIDTAVLLQVIDLWGCRFILILLRKSTKGHTYPSNTNP